MQNIVENFSRQQYRDYQKNGKVMSTNFNFANYYEEYKLHQDLKTNPATSEFFDTKMFKINTENKDGEFMGQAMIMGSEDINNQIFQGKFDATDEKGNVTKPDKEQIWKHLMIQWSALSKEDKEEWNDASKNEADIPTTGFLFFANQLITQGEDHEWMASRNIKLFQDPNRKDK